MEKINKRPVLKSGCLIIGYDGTTKEVHEIKSVSIDKVTVLNVMNNKTDNYSINEFYTYFEEDIKEVKSLLSGWIDTLKSAIDSESNYLAKEQMQSRLSNFVDHANKAVLIEQKQNSIINCVVLKISELSDFEIIDLIMFLGLSNQLQSHIKQTDVLTRKESAFNYLVFMDGINEIVFADVTQKIKLKREGYKMIEVNHRFDFFSHVNKLAPLQPQK